MRNFNVFLMIFCVGIMSAQVSPFVTATWNQTCYYNAQTPTVSSGGSCGRAYTGCNATALAMICKYYSWPANGIGGTYCNTNFTTHCVNFGAQTYNFSSMPLNVTSANAEVAKLMYNLGVACNMQWSGTNSTSFFSGSVLKKYFAYSPKMYSTAVFMFSTTTDLVNAIKAELDAGRPVFAKGGSHFYLIDGYNSSNQFHMNFGWSGTHNGYYSITSVVNAAGNFTPSNFIFMIKPMSGTLETSSDTVIVSAGANVNQLMEFTSLSNFTVSSMNSWITTSLNIGSPGNYDASNGGTFNTLVNNGLVRYGSIVIQNSTSTKTLVVKQEASPLVVNPSPLNFTASGSTETVSVSFFSFGTWTVTTPNSWLNLSTATGTGNGSFSVTASANTSTLSRNGWVIVKGGQYTDSISVTQAAETSTVTTSVQLFSDKNENIKVYPNPSNKWLTVEVNEEFLNLEFNLKDQMGREILKGSIDSNKSAIDVSKIPNGIYQFQFEGKSRKILVLHD